MNVWRIVMGGLWVAGKREDHVRTHQSHYIDIWLYTYSPLYIYHIYALLIFFFVG